MSSMNIVFQMNVNVCVMYVRVSCVFSNLNDVESLFTKLENGRDGDLGSRRREISIESHSFCTKGTGTTGCTKGTVDHRPVPVPVPVPVRPVPGTGPGAGTVHLESIDK